MRFQIPQLLTPEELDTLTKTLAQADFVDGKVTAGNLAKLVKDNRQLKPNSTAAQHLRRVVIAALQRSELFQAAARPRAVHSILFSRYEAGMAYGRHVDNALMTVDGELFRTDLSFTVFLSEPDTYDGGELVIEGADDEERFKLAAGAAIVYPSTALHRVEPVTRGTRLVGVGWVQSLVRSAEQREILFDLEVVRRSLFSQSGKTDAVDLIAKTVSNLLRQWAE